MDETDERVIAELQRDARITLSDLALRLDLSRTTVRSRIEKLRARGEIVGFRVVLKQDVLRDPVRGLMMIGIEGRGTERVLRQLQRMSEVRTVHTTNGRWDIIVELGTATLETLDQALTRIRLLEGVSTSETSLLLSTRFAG